jgi:hypothetical protein
LQDTIAVRTKKNMKEGKRKKRILFCERFSFQEKTCLKDI